MSRRERGPRKPHRARFRFYAELNDFLPADRRGVMFEHPFRGHPAVKDTIEALGVPHTEVDLILVDGTSVGFDHQLRDGNRVSVFPVFESIDISPLMRVRPEPLRQVRFVLDTHLGKLAGYLRMLGFDAQYQNDFQDEELAHISAEHGRILLTRDRGLLKRNRVTHGYCVRSTRPRQQLLEVLRRFDLFRAVQPFRRCIRCNGLLEEVAKAEIREKLPPMARAHYERFRRCARCGQIYWRGSHFERMERFLEGVLREGRDRSGRGALHR
jgi:uncharacterized protein with PIN domain